MEKAKARWCRRFTELLLAAGGRDIQAAVELAIAAYPSASGLRPEEAAWMLLGEAGELRKVSMQAGGTSPRPNPKN